MVAASSILVQKPTLNLKNHLYHSPQSPTRPPFINFRIRIKSFKKLSVKCTLPYNNIRGNNDSADDQDINKQIGCANMEIKRNYFEFVAKSIINALKALKKPAAAAVLVGLLLMYDPNSALAAGSGGRMGGNSLSSRSSMSLSSSSSSSRSHTTPRSEAESGFSYSVPSMSSTRSYTAPRSPAESGFSYYVPYYEPSPFDDIYVGPAAPAAGVGSTAFLIIIAVVAFGLVGGYLSEGSEGSSVLKLQVGLLGLGRSLQKDLNRIAETADTSTSEGLHYVLTETVLALLRHPDYCISTYSSVDVKRSMEKGEKRLNQLSIEERGKFDEETLVNVNNIKKQSSTCLRASGLSNEYIVITILVAAGGEHKLPSINNSKDLKEALQKLASIPSNRTLAVEVLWTPQNEDDNLSERELLEDYPLLRPL